MQGKRKSGDSTSQLFCSRFHEKRLKKSARLDEQAARSLVVPLPHKAVDKAYILDWTIRDLIEDLGLLHHQLEAASTSDMVLSAESRGYFQLWIILKL